MIVDEQSTREIGAFRSLDSDRPRDRDHGLLVVSVGRAAVGRDGAFVARLAPGTYRLRLPGDSRTIMVEVPNGECIDMVLDFRLPMIVLKVPAEGWPMPGLA